MVILSFVMFLITGASAIFRSFGIAIRVAIDILLMFALPLIIIKKYNFDVAMTKSYNIVKNDFVRSLVFWFFMNFVRVVILGICVFLVGVLLLPTVLQLGLNLIGMQTLTISQMVQIIILILGNYSNLMLISVISSLFLATIPIVASNLSLKAA